MKKIAGLFLFAVAFIQPLHATDTTGIFNLHYFYNSSWLLETEKHVLVFDFIPHHESGISFPTLQKSLQQSGVAQKKVVVFISHDHQDHFNDSIFSALAGNKAHFILGWKPAKPPGNADIATLAPGDSIVSTGLTVFTHPATDDGSAFLVKIDGVTIYHGGDHALWVEDLVPPFTKELQAIKAKAGKIDLAFVPAARGMFAKCAVDSTIEKGVQLTTQILQPAYTALQHIGCADKLFQYEGTRQRLSVLKTKWIVPAKFDSVYNIK